MIDDEDDIWGAYAKHVKPLKRAVSKKSALSESLAKTVSSKYKHHSPHPSPPREGKGIPARSRQVDFTTPIDRSIERRLRQGDIAVDARIDLHGMKQDEAHEALEHFLAQQIKVGRRCLLVITGKGRGKEGVLRSNLGKWLLASLHARQILALRPAALKHGGTGAFYVMLRRLTK